MNHQIEELFDFCFKFHFLRGHNYLISPCSWDVLGGFFSVAMLFLRNFFFVFGFLGSFAVACSFSFKSLIPPASMFNLDKISISMVSGTFSCPAATAAGLGAASRCRVIVFAEIWGIPSALFR